MNYLQSIILAIVEGISEFLPISSTGHMIIASSFMGIQSDPFVKLFTVCIQLGAILSVLVLYFKRFFKSLDFYFKLAIGFLPAAVFGVLLSDKIDELLENPICVALSLLIGGIVLLYADKWFDKGEVDNSDELSYPQAFKIGLFQCLAMIPGVSRSASSIIGGMAIKLTRKAAAEFSFFLAVPTMFGATAKKLLDFYKEGYHFKNNEISILFVGNTVAFIVALLAIKSFIGFLNKYGFKPFGWYRILVGLVLLTLYFSGVGLHIL